MHRDWSYSMKRSTCPPYPRSSPNRQTLRGNGITRPHCISAFSVMLYSIETGSKRGKFVQELGFEPDIDPDIIVPDAEICSSGSVIGRASCRESDPPFFYAVCEKLLDFLSVVFHFRIICIGIGATP